MQRFTALSLLLLAACDTGDLGESTAEISHAPVARLTAAGAQVIAKDLNVRFPSSFRADQVIALYDSDGDGVINTAGGDPSYTFPVAVAPGVSGFEAGSRIGSSIQVGSSATTAGPGFCGDILVYAVDGSGPGWNESYFFWLALRSSSYVPRKGCADANTDAGVGAFDENTGAVVHHETVVGGTANGSQISSFSGWADFGAGTAAYPGRVIIDRIAFIRANQINGTLNQRIELTDVSIDAPLIREEEWDGSSMFTAGNGNVPGDSPDADLIQHASTIGGELLDPNHLRWGDASGDGLDDLCLLEGARVTCAVMGDDGRLGVFRPWNATSGWEDLQYSTYRQTAKLADVDGDGDADLCALTSAGVRCGLSDGERFAGSRIWSSQMSGAAGWSARGRAQTIGFPDVNGDGAADLCGRSWDGMHCAISYPGFQGFIGLWRTYAAFTDARGFGAEDKWGTLAYADVNGDGNDDVCVRGIDGIYCARGRGNGFEADRRWTSNFRDAYGWNADQYWRTIQLGDVNGDGAADLCGRGSAGVYCAPSVSGQFDPVGLVAPAFSDGNGWNQAKYYKSLRLVDVSGDGVADVCGRGSAGIWCAVATPDGYTRHVRFGPTELRYRAFGDEPHRGPESVAVGDSFYFWDSLRPARIDRDPGVEICAVTYHGIECTRP